MPEEKKNQEKKNRSFFKPDTYEEFRNFLKVNFYYCSLSHEQQSKYIKSFGTTRYNEYKNIVEKISEGKIAFPKYNKKKSFKYDVTQFESDYNVFANSFQLKIEKQIEYKVCIIIFALFILSSSNESMSISQIIKLFSGDNGAQTDNSDKKDNDNKTESNNTPKKREILDDKTISAKIKELYEYGLISKEGKKYFIEESCFYSIDEEILLKLLNMADFMKNLVYPEVSGYNLFNLLKNVYEDRTCSEYDSPFQFKYSHLANILDDNVLWSLIEAIENRQQISFTYENKKKENIIPVKIFTENEYNRRYLFAVTREPFKFYIFKLSEIYDLQIINGTEPITEEEFESYIEVYQAKKKYSFAGKMDFSAKTQTIRLQFKNSRKVKDQLKKDFKCIKFEKGNIAEVTIRGKKKMIKPYLRANMGLIKTTDEELSVLIDSEIEEMKRNYGIIS